MMLAPPEPLPNARNQMGGMMLLRAVRDGAAALAFLDPQYRVVLDRQRYGNEGARQKGRVALPQQSDDGIRGMVEDLARALRPSGHLMLWVDKYIVGSGHHLCYLRDAPSLAVVDLIAWNKTRPGMGRRARCQTEYVVVLQKLPTRAKGIWTDTNLPDSWTEQADRSRHPHAKPHVLTERLIRATTRRGDLVLDPCAGSYVVLDACQASGRQFLGCDISEFRG
jgi:site-specific DNA-methyltransferase (adenine-specific)